MPAPILCFGEILWDCLPEGLFPGGAPANVAYHLHRHGEDARLVSALGRDLLGDELLRRLRRQTLNTDHLARHPGLPTGTVVAEVSATGDARYAITRDAAWDRIPADAPALAAARRAAALVFGSLALRETPNRASLDALLAALPPAALRAFDVNLRAPHDDLPLVRSLAPRATLLKLNAAEAARLADDPAGETPGAEETHARALHSRHGCPLVLVTSGPRGAGLLREGRAWTWEPGRPVEVVDTVGAGDGFLASFLHHLLPGQSSDGEILSRACRHGEWIATRRGATPAYPPS
jgi:fructokinase